MATPPACQIIVPIVAFPDICCIIERAVRKADRRFSVDIAAIEEIILEFLAEDAGCPVDQLRAELSAGGLDLPVDSLLAVEVLTRVENATGVRLPAIPETALALRSVHGFALAVIRQLDADQARSVSA
jgi:acyl carrier protein